VNSCTSLKRLYDRNDFPISIMHDAKGNKINWKVINYKKKRKLKIIYIYIYIYETIGGILHNQIIIIIKK